MKLVAVFLVAFVAIPSFGFASNNGQNNTIVTKLNTEDDVAEALAKYIANLSTKFIKEKGSFSVALSGGSLIDTMRKLLHPPYNTTVDWSKWLIFWVDERVVPLDDPLSNYKLALDGFLSKVPIPKSNIYAIKYKNSSEEVAVDYETRLKSLVQKNILPLSATGFAKIDLLLLGIGFDGHVGSLFPDRPQRYEKKRWITFINDSPKPPPQRITITFPLMNSAPYIAMVVTGKGAADVVAATLGDHPVVPSLPCGEVKAVEELTWFLDKDSASGLH